ncbi:MAG: PilZ domain-containing protein [Candidatus Omnitrophica bacterium]|nr:PilZ domain-containing protein [Candidatus Omnitrophota bacterium]
MPEVNVENRIFERIPLFLPASFCAADPHVGDQVFVSDISSNGVRIKTQNRLFYGDNVSVDVQIPGQEIPVKVEGRVMWARIRGDHMWDVGLRFAKPLLVKMASLYNFVFHSAVSES